jgi:hypothetical protein
MTLAKAGTKAISKTKHFSSTGMNYDRQNIFMEQATGACPRVEHLK